MRARRRLRAARSTRSSAPTTTSRNRTRHGKVAHDAWTTLAGLAARTTTLRLGTLVSPATFRLPGLLANAVATVDHISGGRVELGIGGGWMEREHRAYGFPFPTHRRGSRCSRNSSRSSTASGPSRASTSTARTTRSRTRPRSRSRQYPRPPLLVGGSGTRGTAVPAAHFADEYNTPFKSPEDLLASSATSSAPAGRSAARFASRP